VDGEGAENFTRVGAERPVRMPAERARVIGGSAPDLADAGEGDGRGAGARDTASELGHPREFPGKIVVQRSAWRPGHVPGLRGLGLLFHAIKSPPAGIAGKRHIVDYVQFRKGDAYSRKWQ
jgi:hypothetical protein